MSENYWSDPQPSLSAPQPPWDGESAASPLARAESPEAAPPETVEAAPPAPAPAPAPAAAPEAAAAPAAAKSATLTPKAVWKKVKPELLRMLRSLHAGKTDAQIESELPIFREASGTLQDAIGAEGADLGSFDTMSVFRVLGEITWRDVGRPQVLAMLRRQHPRLSDAALAELKPFKAAEALCRAPWGPNATQVRELAHTMGVPECAKALGASSPHGERVKRGLDAVAAGGDLREAQTVQDQAAELLGAVESEPEAKRARRDPEAAPEATPEARLRASPHLQRGPRRHFVCGSGYARVCGEGYCKNQRNILVTREVRDSELRTFLLSFTNTWVNLQPNDRRIPSQPQRRRPVEQRGGEPAAPQLLEDAREVADVRLASRMRVALVAVARAVNIAAPHMPSCPHPRPRSGTAPLRSSDLA